VIQPITCETALKAMYVYMYVCVCVYIYIYIYIYTDIYTPVTVAARSKPWTVFARSDAGIMGSNPTQGMDVWCVYGFILCLGSGLATGWSLVLGVPPSVKNDYEIE
jgi:hypothetical protein